GDSVAGPSALVDAPPRRLPQRVERGDHRVGDTGVHQLGEVLTGGGCQHDAPHAVAAGDVDVAGGGLTDERFAVGAHRPRTHPFILTLVEVDAPHETAGLIDDRLDAVRVQGLIRATELHGPGNAETTLVRG